MRCRLLRLLSKKSELGVSEYYDRLCLQYEDDALAVGWRNAFRQNLRFEVLSLLGEFDGKKVLDVGCGLGAFYGFLKEFGIEFEYVGIDVSGEMVKRARGEFPGVKFVQGDFLTMEVGEQFDFVVASGAMSFKVETPEVFLVEMVQKMFFLAKEGIGFNLLSDRYEGERVGRFGYFEAKEVLGVCLDMTPFVGLRHDYLENDFSVFMYR